MLASGTILQNRYYIQHLIGQGGMGAVYLADDQRLGNPVALKETLFSDSQEMLRRAFEREARLLARLRHPALPVVSDHFIEGEGQFLVMQYIAGDDLEKIIKSRGMPCTPQEVLIWADQLLDALDYLHTQSPPIIHRDIKPQNLKLASRNQIILLDFGLAKGSVTGMSQVTTGSSLYGYTPHYAPLEQIEGSGTDPRSDLYSLAATLYYLLTGVVPPDALTRASQVLHKSPDPLQSPHELNAQISSLVAATLMKAMSLDTEERYANAEAMRHALREAALNASHRSSPSGVGETSTVVVASPTRSTPGNAETIRVEQATVQPAIPTTPLPWHRAGWLSVRRSKRLQWMIAGGFVLLVTGISLALYFNRKTNSPGSNSPGPLSTVHASKTRSSRAIAVRASDGSCVKCHSKAASLQNQCISCHTTQTFNPILAETRISKGHNQEGIECAACHSEHKGSDFHPAAVENRKCLTCHNGKYIIQTGADAGEALPFPHGNDIAYPVEKGKWVWKLSAEKWKLSAEKLKKLGQPDWVAIVDPIEQFHAIHSYSIQESETSPKAALITCSDCHTAGQVGDEQWRTSPRATCSKCHSTEMKANCTDCHNQHKPIESTPAPVQPTAPAAPAKKRGQ